MNRKQLILLFVALAIIGGAGLVLLQRHQQSWTESGAQIGQKLLSHYQVNDVAAIHIKSDTDLTLDRKDDGWHVQERGQYPANITQIKELLLKMGDLKVVQSDPIGASQLGRMHLAEPGKGADSAVLLEFKDAQGKPLQSLLLGKKHTHESDRPSPMPFGDEGFADGRYVMLGSDPKPY
jgi:Flp pilus assembly protein CpaB